MSARGRSGIRTICTLIPLLCCSALGQQLQVENAASLRVGDIAVGSLAKLQLIYQGGAITPIDPPTVSVQFQPAAPGLTLRLQVLEVPDALSVLTLIPAEAPLGPGIVTLNYNGQSSSASVNIVSTSFGLYSGTGEMALAQNITTNGIQLNNLTHPAHPQVPVHAPKDGRSVQVLEIELPRTFCNLNGDSRRHPDTRIGYE